MSTQIPLTQGRVALIDDADLPLVSQYRWQYHLRDYAVGWVKGKMVYLHRFLMDAPHGIAVDHINGDKLDNTRANLRFATTRQNSQNQSVKANSHSGYKEVTKANSLWRFRIQVDGKSIELSTFGDPVKAALMYDAAACHFFGEYARTNFPPEAILDSIQAALQRQLQPKPAPQPKSEKRASSYRGVSWHEGQWRARIKVQGRDRHLGLFGDEVAAAKRYDYAARKAYGEQAILNFP